MALIQSRGDVARLRHPVALLYRGCSPFSWRARGAGQNGRLERSASACRRLKGKPLNLVQRRSGGRPSGLSRGHRAASGAGEPGTDMQPPYGAAANRGPRGRMSVQCCTPRESGVNIEDGDGVMRASACSKPAGRAVAESPFWPAMIKCFCLAMQ